MTYEPTEDELAVAALANCADVGPATIRALRTAAATLGRPLADLLRPPHAAIQSAADLAPGVVRAIRALTDPAAAGRTVVDRLHALGGCAVWAGCPGYPRRLSQALGEAAPAVLFLLGRPALLEAPCVAVVGSRLPSSVARRLARRLAADLAAQGSTVVSGGARGIDTAGHRGALLTGATAVVPALGLERYLRRTAWLPGPGSGGWCLVGQFPLHSTWRTAHALSRNRTTAALSDAVVAFEPRDTGGTWRTCLDALRLRKPLFVVAAQTDAAKGRGLRRLVRMGAVALDPGHMPAADAFARLVSEYEPPALLDQTELFEEQ